MEIQGRIKAINSTKTYGSKGFKKREVVIVTAEQYPQHLLVEFVQDKCDLLDSFREDTDVRISINLRGREWTNAQGETKYFNTIQGWRIEEVSEHSMPEEDHRPSHHTKADRNMRNAVNNKDEDDDDLPF